MARTEGEVWRSECKSASCSAGRCLTSSRGRVPSDATRARRVRGMHVYEMSSRGHDCGRGEHTYRRSLSMWCDRNRCAPQLSHALEAQPSDLSTRRIRSAIPGGTMVTVASPPRESSMCPSGPYYLFPSSWSVTHFSVTRLAHQGKHNDVPLSNVQHLHEDVQARLILDPSGVTTRCRLCSIFDSKVPFYEDPIGSAPGEDKCEDTSGR